MDFPITDLLDEDACYAKLVTWLHPEGLACPRCRRADRMRVHRSHRAHVRDDRRGHCKRLFNAFTGTALHGSRRRPSELVLIMRGFAQGVPTAQLARELACDRSELLVTRKHTRFGDRRFREAISHAVLELDSFRRGESGRIALMRDTPFDDVRAE